MVATLDFGTSITPLFSGRRVLAGRAALRRVHAVGFMWGRFRACEAAGVAPLNGLRQQPDPKPVTQPNAVIEIANPNGATVWIGNRERLTIIAGPCQLESRQHALETATQLKEIAARLGVGLIYKTSFDKAN